MDDFLQPAEEYSNNQTYESTGFGFTGSNDAFGIPNSNTSSASTNNTGAAAILSDGPNPLTVFNTKFRAAGEEKDHKEREAKNVRKQSGKTTLKKLLAERKTIVDARKIKNREDESATEQGMLDALQGESWSRVVTLIDVHTNNTTNASSSSSSTSSSSTSSSGSSSSDKKSKQDAHAVNDTSRMKDILIGLKSKPLTASSQ